MANKDITEHIGNASKTAANDKWWTCDESKAYQSLFATVEYIKQSQSYRQTENLRFARMYSNKPIRGLSVADYNSIESVSDRLAYNVVKSCVDTAASKIAKNKPKPLFMTENGDFSLKRRAQNLTQYMEGMFDDMDLYSKGQSVFVDAAVFGTGAMKIYIDPSDLKIKAERVLIDEIIVDDIEGMYAAPRQMHQIKYIARDVLLEMFPDKKVEIIKASPAKNFGLAASTTDNIMVLESWHLPSGPKAKDGKHIIAINQATLSFEDYTKDHFPFVFFRWTKKLVGFWGMGIAEELIGLQIEINDVLRSIQKAIRMMAVPRIYVENSSKVNSAHINNDIGNIITFTGTKPIQEVAQAMSAEVYQYLEQLYQRAFELTGISRLSAQSQKPAGLNSGAALREFQDIESERFMLAGQHFEDMYMQAAQQIVELSKELYDIKKDKSKTDKSVSKDLIVKVKSSKFIKKINWKDVDMDRDQYEMAVFPVNLLPSTPAGKLATIQEMIQAGLIPQEQAIELLDFPDLDKFMSLQTAAQDNIERMLELMTEEGEYNSPEPFMNLKLALTLTQETYLRCKCDKLSEERLQLLRDFMDDIQTLLNPPPPPVDPNMPIPGAMPAPIAGPVASGGAPPPAELAPMTGNPLPTNNLPL